MAANRDHEKLYEKGDDGAFIIDVALDRYVDVFNEWDPSPFRKRDMDRDLLLFLEDCSYDIPLQQRIKIRFTLPENKMDEKREAWIREGVGTHFRVEVNRMSREMADVR